jgi:predicted HTH domain antitoxin
MRPLPEWLHMTTWSLTLQLPEELLAALGSPEEATAKAKEALVMELLREARISQGYAATLLGISRWDLLELMGRYRVPQGPLTAEELAHDVAAAREAADAAH